jgi:hypothetical protein
MEFNDEIAANETVRNKNSILTFFKLDPSEKKVPI